MSDHTVEGDQTWPRNCPACGTELTSAVIDLDPTNADHPQLNPGEMVAMDYCPNPECPLKETEQSTNEPVE